MTLTKCILMNTNGAYVAEMSLPHVPRVDEDINILPPCKRLTAGLEPIVRGTVRRVLTTTAQAADGGWNQIVYLFADILE